MMLYMNGSLGIRTHTKQDWISGGSRIFVFGGLTGRVLLFGWAKWGLSAEGANLRLPKARSPHD